MEKRFVLLLACNGDDRAELLAVPRTRFLILEDDAGIQTGRCMPHA